MNLIGNPARLWLWCVGVVLLTLLVWSGLSGPLSAQGAVGTEDQRLVNPDRSEDDFFGASVAVDGDTMVIGANRAEVGSGAFAGAAYVFESVDGRWVWTQTITSSNATDGDLFGNSVDIDGNTIVVSAANEGAEREGAAYVFVQADGVWVEQARLGLDDSNAFDGFGGSVAVDGDTIVVGAVRGEGPSVDEGAVYVFNRANGRWTQQATLNASDGETGNRFGEKVAIDDDTILVGSPRAQDSGAAYVFANSGGAWAQEAILLAGNAGSGAEFGDSLALSGDTAIVGAPRSVGGGIDLAGAAYVYTRVGTFWSEQQVLVGSDTATGDFFGAAVAIDEDHAVVGATFGDSAGGAAGSAYLFALTGTQWMEQQTFGSSAPAVSDRFGAAVDLDLGAGVFVVGAPSFDVDGLSDSGAANVFTLANSAGVRCANAAITVNLGLGELPTDGDDVILGTDGPDVINARGGDDIICGGGGDDLINGGDGRDTILGGAGNDTINAGQGLDTVFGEDGDDFVSGGKGKDTLIGGAGNDDLRGNEGTDTIDGGAGDDELRGGQKADLLVGGEGDDNLVGGTRPDILDGGAGVDTYNGGGGSGDVCVPDAAGLVEVASACER